MQTASFYNVFRTYVDQIENVGKINAISKNNALNLLQKCENVSFLLNSKITRKF